MRSFLLVCCLALVSFVVVCGYRMLGFEQSQDGMLTGVVFASPFILALVVAGVMKVHESYSAMISLWTLAALSAYPLEAVWLGGKLLGLVITLAG